MIILGQVTIGMLVTTQDHLLMVETGIEVIPEEIMSHIIDKSWALCYSTAIL